jgi:hypothetical protein
MQMPYIPWLMRSPCMMQHGPATAQQHAIVQRACGFALCLGTQYDLLLLRAACLWQWNKGSHAIQLSGRHQLARGEASTTLPLAWGNRHNVLIEYLAVTACVNAVEVSCFQLCGSCRCLCGSSSWVQSRARNEAGPMLILYSAECFWQRGCQPVPSHHSGSAANHVRSGVSR